MDEFGEDSEKTALSRGQEREPWCLLGLPFDLVTMEETCSFIETAVKNRTTSILSVVNTHWVGLAQNDLAFCEHIACSDLNVADGIPVFWVALFLGLPIRERVAGPAIIERLMEKKSGQRKKVYFFGGDRNAAENACQRLRDSGSGLTGAGYCNPGFGSLEEMSGEDFLRDINEAAPDILVLANGAQKGMAWIERNKKKITVGVISYLGAVINLLAENIKRAPPGLQKACLEWAWRIYQEPQLWRRYFIDALLLLKILVTKIVPLKVATLCNRRFESERQPPAMNVVDKGECVVINIRGVCNRHGRREVRKVFWEAARLTKDVEVALEGVPYIESAFLGNLFLLWKETRKENRKLSVTGANATVRRIFSLSMADGFFRVGGNKEC